MVWLVAAVFVLQLLSSAAAIYFLRGQMLEVVRADRMRQVIDVRDDLLAAYTRRTPGAGADDRPSGRRRPIRSCSLRSPDRGALLSKSGAGSGIEVSSRPRPVMVHLGSDIPDIEGMAIAGNCPTANA
jgi:hypothetical protein